MSLKARLARLEAERLPPEDLRLTITRRIVGLDEDGELITLATVRREVTVKRGNS